MTSSTYAMYVALGFRSLAFFNTELNKILGVYEILEQRIGSIHEHPDYFTKQIEELKLQVTQEIERV